MSTGMYNKQPARFISGARPVLMTSTRHPDARSVTQGRGQICPQHNLMQQELFEPLTRSQKPLDRETYTAFAE